MPMIIKPYCSHMIFGNINLLISPFWIKVFISSYCFQIEPKSLSCSYLPLFQVLSQLFSLSPFSVTLEILFAEKELCFLQLQSSCLETEDPGSLALLNLTHPSDFMYHFCREAFFWHSVQFEFPVTNS